MIPFLGINESEGRIIRRAAALHDVGRVAIPDSILEKPGPLTDEERHFIHQHTLIGERILAVAPALVAASRLVRGSHEHVDGSGYPDGLAGEDIPIGSRLIAVCDAYEAMTSDRPYARSQSSTEAIAELRRCAGTQFDPGVVEAFVQTLQAEHRVGAAEVVRGHSVA